MKKETTSPKKTSKVDKLSSDENISPVRKPNTMMMNWLSKSASKKNDGDEEKSKMKNIDSNARKEKVELSVKEKTSPKEEFKKKKTKVVESSDDEDPSPIKLKAKKTTEKKPKIENDDVEEKPKKRTTKTVESPKDKEKEAPAKKGANKFYAAYMRREGPKNPGSKPVPIGKKDCFAGLKFLVTGVLDSLDRDECKKIVEKYGGSMISGVTKKLDYLIVGEDAGDSKLQKARELNVKQLNEDEFLKLICTKSGITEPKYENMDVEMMDEELEMKQETEVKQEIKAEKSTTPVKAEKKTPASINHPDFLEQR